MRKSIIASILASSILMAGISSGQGIPRRQKDPIPASVETVYTKGLRYLANTQNDDGSWSGTYGNYPGVVGLCVLAFLAHGEDANHGPYADNIRKGLDFLLKQQKESNGYIGNSMYNHGFATLALAESYGMVEDKRLAPALKNAVKLILTAQENNPKGGWRYTPESNDADSTVAGCQLVALLAARNAGVPVPDASIEKGLKYMASCRGSNGAYGYTSRGGGKPTLTAIGSLCYSLSKNKDAKGFQESLEYLKKQMDYRDKYYPYYFEYYMSQALFHADEEVWKAWNEKNVRYLSTIQAADGSFPGNKGQTFSTAGALLSLALNYRFLPIYEK
ncbi:hypothetical protein Rhal01_02337 [Rubritalea halochordaticola]|uniref:Squalene--hopene cyclase n=1 Tax=Rubritalea halochordaticola TaxID=714537 RepID=A0ABP9V0K8_9BACT